MSRQPEPDDFANVWTIVDWIDEFTDANNSPDLDDDDDEIGAAWDPMADWPLDGDDEEEEDGEGEYEPDDEDADADGSDGGPEEDDGAAR